VGGVTTSPAAGVRPLVVISGGTVVDLLAMNERAYVKTRESRSLWVTDADGSRELPYRPAPGGTSRIADVRRGDSWYAVALGDETAAESAEPTEAAPNPARTTPARTTVAPHALDELAVTIRERKEANPDTSYTGYLFDQGVDKIRKKVGEEAIEVITAGSAEELISESADLLYHLVALLEAQGVRLDQVYAELERRRR
jgi:phosphoribosyl-ATP pyrophosphohydrolase